MENTLSNQYIHDNTQHWERLSKEGNIELWSYKDLVAWDWHHCIKVDGMVKIVIEPDDKLNPYTAMDLAVKLLGTSESEQ